MKSQLSEWPLKYSKGVICHRTLSCARSSVSAWGDSAESFRRSSWAWSSVIVFWAWWFTTHTHTHTDLIYPEIISHLSCDKTKNNSVHWQWLLPAQTLLRAAASEPPPCAGSQPTDSTRSVPDGKQKRHRHTINTHRQMANTRVYVKIPGPSSSTIEQNTHTHKSCSTCVPS